MRFLFIIILLLSGCAGKNQSQKLVDNIENEIKKSHNIDHGSIIAKYDLIGASNKKCLYLKDYGKIINNSSDNRKFIHKMTHKISKKHIMISRAKDKISIIKEDLMRLNNKYKIFSDSDARKLYPEEEDFDAFTKIDGNLEDYLKDLNKIDKLSSHIPIFFPHGKSRITSPFGMRKHPITKIYKLHTGTDFAGSQKHLPIYAAADGRVLEAGKMSGYGNTITITHGKIFKTRYAHLSKIFVKKGDNIIKGQKIGIEGNTGNSTADHLHFEIIIKGSHINPVDFISSGHQCQSL